MVCESDDRAIASAKREGVGYYPLNISAKMVSWNDLRSLAKLRGLLKFTAVQIMNSCTKKGGLLSSIAANLAKNLPKRIRRA